VKILLVIHSLNHVGGAETILVHYANYFASKEDAVSICILDNEKIYFNLESTISLYRKKSDNRSLLSQIKFIKNTTKQCNPDVIMSSVSAVNIISTVAAKIAKKPIVMSEHSSYENGLKNNIWKLLRRMVYPFANKLIILTEEDKKKYHYVKDVQVLRNPLILHQNHLDLERENIILAVGRLEYIKGFDMLIEAFSKLNHPNWKLMIAGEGSERKALESLIESLNLKGKVILLGFVEDMEYVYRNASIFVLSSRTEGFPGALCEAMGYGCASIAFDCETGPKEIICHGENGILVPANNVKKLSEEMNQLMADEKLRAYLGENSQSIKNELNIEKLGREWRGILEDTILVSHQQNRRGKK
jgi:GalNAc-alpha-(1->4)-GalNAc-alpha-(1->3)-diNAcBac-PP-undecaprenol alpha-1,4-N-acetyl-D-galactosaminyltransferase